MIPAAEKVCADRLLWCQLARAAARPYNFHILQPFHHRWISLLADHRETMLLAPRGHLKSTLADDFALGDILMNVDDGLQPRAMIVCDNKTARNAFIREMYRVLASETVQTMFGGFAVSRTVDTITIPDPPVPPWCSAGRVIPTGYPTIAAFTVDSRSGGIHIDKGWLLLDDAWVSSAAASRTKIASRAYRIKDSWLAMISPQTKIAHLGTRYTEWDEYVKLADRIAWNRQSAAAWKDASRTEPLWPQVWSAGALEAARKYLGRLSFDRQFMNLVSPAMDRLFAPADLAAAAEITVPADARSRGATVVGIDVAYGGDDHTAAVRAYVMDGVIYLMGCLKQQYVSAAEKWQELARYCIDADYVLIEGGGPQKENDQLLEAGGEAIGQPLGPVETYAPTKNKRIKLEPLAAMIERGQVGIPCERIRDEMAEVTGADGEEDDVADAAYLAIRAAMRYIEDERFEMFSSGFSAPGNRAALTDPRTFLGLR